MLDSTGTRHILEETSTERDLGVLINNRLKWSDHIAHAKAKAYATMGMLKRAFRTWDKHSFRILYTTYVRPHLEYCSSIWNPSYEEDIRSLESVQKRATKFVPDLRSAKYRVRLEAIGIPSLAQRRRRGDLIQYFKIIKGYNKVTWIKEPSLAASLSTQGPARNIRGHANRIRREELTSFTPREDFLSNRVVADWNALPVAVGFSISTEES